jgi:hypothetical protein
MFSHRRPFVLIPALLAFGLAVGCRKAEVTSYRAPKDTAATTPTAATSASALPADHPPIAGAPAATSPTMATTAVPMASGDLRWTAPAHWQSKPASSMRKATYAIPGEAGADGDLSITVLSSDGGGEAANLTRWRGQLGLPDAPATEIAKAVTRLEAGPLKIALADFANDKATPPARVLGAIVPVGTNTWFFKLTGPPALLEKEKPAFIEFLKTLKAP